jgi:hypothetical protein
MLMNKFHYCLLLNFAFLSPITHSQPLPLTNNTQANFQSYYYQNWQEVFYDPGNEDWHTRWFLDGTKAKVSNDQQKMTIDTTKNVFAVLWTKEEFKGDLKIEYDFLRQDDYPHGVNIIYIQATGSGKSGYDKDISKWSDKRKNAYMSDYYAHMHTYHISYATDGDDYIRGRRYMPNQLLPDPAKLWWTAIKGETKHAGIFADQQWIHVTIIKHEKELFVSFQHPNKNIELHMENTDKPGITEGRIGLRLMPKRLSYFKNISISTL